MAGVRECAWCRAYLGEAPDLPAGAVTHGICQGCRDRMMRELERPGWSDHIRERRADAARVRALLWLLVLAGVAILGAAVLALVGITP